jgi:hypothetical protein
MRTRAGQILSLAFAGALAFIACWPCVPGDDAVALEVEMTSPARANSFVARLISLECGSSASFIAHLGDRCLPVWERLRAENVVSGVSVFELGDYDSTMSQSPACDYLVLVELATGIPPASLLDAEAASACLERQGDLRFTVLRTALMSCTPNSCHGMPEPGHHDGGEQLDYLVEFIGVEDAPDPLAKYRHLMSKYFGPANGLLVERGMLHCFVALENTRLLQHSPGAVAWNQIHISDDWDAGGDVDWDSVYVEVFRSALACDLDSVWAELPPTDDSRDCRGRLMQGLCVR